MPYGHQPEPFQRQVPEVLPGTVDMLEAPRRPQ